MVELTQKGELALLNVRLPQLRRISSLWASLTGKEKLLLIHLLAKLRMVLLARYAEDETAASLGEMQTGGKRPGRARLRPVGVLRAASTGPARKAPSRRSSTLAEERADA